MLTRLFRQTVQKITLPLGRGIAAAGLTANHMSVVGALIVFVAAALIAGGQPLQGGLVILAGGVFDMLDGAVARAKGTSDKAGAFLDSTLDRLSDGVLLGSVVIYLLGDVLDETDAFFSIPLDPGSLTSVGIGLTLACMVLAFLTSYIRARAEGLGLSCSVGIAERTERTILLVAGLILPGTLVPFLALLALVSAITVGQRFVHVWSQARAS